MRYLDLSVLGVEPVSKDKKWWLRLRRKSEIKQQRLLDNKRNHDKEDLPFGR